MTIPTLTQKESVAISYLRVIAMLSIVTCHFMQALDNKLAWVFNIGVQVFLLLSGYLYGHKPIDNWKEWLYKRFERIYVPFLLFIISIIPAYALNCMITWKHLVVYIVDIQGLWGGVKGLGHLWFLTAIAICYVLTPLLQCTRKFSSILIWLIVASFIAVELLIPEYGFRVSWFILYATGYYLAHCNNWEKVSLSFVCFVGLVLSIQSCTWDMIKSTDHINSLVMHVSGAVLIVLFFLALSSRFNIIRVPKVVSWFDQYSFQIYIVHHSLIMPPFGLLNITDSITLNIVIIIAYILLAAMSLSLISDKVTEKMRLLLRANY